MFNNWSFVHKSTIPSRNIELEFKLASPTKVLDYLTKRLERLDKYIDSGFLPDCPDSALGKTTTTTYKVVKPGKERALNNSGGTHNTLDAASIAQSKLTVLSEIKSFTNHSEPVICLRYCPYNKVCEQGKQINLNQKR